MTELREIRADFHADSIVVYQAYGDQIADAALRAGTFVAPFSLNRMTWIKPSFRWLMHRSNWGQKSGQERTLRVRIRRSGWDKALASGVLTSPDGPVFGNAARWQAAFESAQVHVQWDTERSPRGAALDHYSIQVGLSRHIIGELVDSWIVKIEDFTPTVRKLYDLVHGGRTKESRGLQSFSELGISKASLALERPSSVRSGLARPQSRRERPRRPSSAPFPATLARRGQTSSSLRRTAREGA